MCNPKPGNRCATEAGQDLQATQAAYEAQHPDGPAVDPLTAAQVPYAAPEAAAPAHDPEVFTRRYDTVDEKIAAFHAELEAEVANLDKDENWHRYLETMGRFHRYSFSNQVLIALQRPDATQVAGFRAWQSLDRQVRKGERGISIFAPKTAWVELKDASGAPQIGSDGKPLKGKRVIGYTTTTVFDISQTDGKDLPKGIPALSETPPEGFTNDLETAIRNRGFTVEYADTGSSTLHGYTDFKDKKVVIAGSMSDGDRAATLAHELGHIAAGHEARAEEYHTRQDGHRGQIEVEVEAIGFVLCRSAGMQSNLDQSGKYVKGWAGREVEKDTEVVSKSAAHVAKTVKELLTTEQWTHMGTTAAGED